MPVIFHAAGSLTIDTFAKGIRQAEEDGEPALIDLSRVDFVDAFAIVGLACLIAHRSFEQGDVHVAIPSGDVAVYLSRMGFHSLLGDYGVTTDGSFPTVRRNDHGGFLVELTRFHDTVDGEAVANVVWTRLDRNVHSSVVRGMHEGTSELVANVHEHADSPVGGFAAAQTYLRHQPNEYLLLAVGDAGVGLAETLSRHRSRLSDYQAVEKALERDVTGTDDPGRGQGLAEVVEFARTYGGTVAVLSGAAYRMVRSDDASTTPTARFPGTLIGARIPCRPHRGRFR